jgi:hypothetical protein
MLRAGRPSRGQTEIVLELRQILGYSVLSQILVIWEFRFVPPQPLVRNGFRNNEESAPELICARE